MPDYAPYEPEVPEFHHQPGGRALWQDELQPGNYNQFVNVAAPGAYEHGHVRGNPEHKKQEYTRREGRHFKSQVSSSSSSMSSGFLVVVFLLQNILCTYAFQFSVG